MTSCPPTTHWSPGFRLCGVCVGEQTKVCKGRGCDHAAVVAAAWGKHTTSSRRIQLGVMAKLAQKPERHERRTGKIQWGSRCAAGPLACINLVDGDWVDRQGCYPLVKPGGFYLEPS
jgi:hypothetical protein